MDNKYIESVDEATEQDDRYLKTIADVYFYLYGGWYVYDEPMNAYRYGTITSPAYIGGDAWKQWMHDHYVGTENVEERVLKDPYARSYLKRYGLLPECEDIEPSMDNQKSSVG